MTIGVDILLVEDSVEDAALTLRALSKQHLANHVLVARDGAEAIEHLRTLTHLKVMLLDLKLPKVSGLEVLRHVKKDPRLQHLPVVVLTSSREEPDIATAYELGANSYIVKPVDFEHFARAVADAGLYWLLLNQPARARL